MTATTSDAITHSQIQTALEAKGFEVYGEDTGGGCWVSYAVKNDGKVVTLGPFSWEEENGLILIPGDFYIGPESMDPETGDVYEPYPEMVTVQKEHTLADVVNIVISEHEKMNS
jgi:hypothetical protein